MSKSTVGGMTHATDGVGTASSGIRSQGKGLESRQKGIGPLCHTQASRAAVSWSTSAPPSCTPPLLCIPSGCCGTCSSKVLDGVVDQDLSTTVMTPGQRAEGFVLLCSTYPRCDKPRPSFMSPPSELPSETSVASTAMKAMNWLNDVVAELAQQHVFRMS